MSDVDTQELTLTAKRKGSDDTVVVSMLTNTYSVIIEEKFHAYITKPLVDTLLCFRCRFRLVLLKVYT